MKTGIANLKNNDGAIASSGKEKADVLNAFSVQFLPGKTNPLFRTSEKPHIMILSWILSSLLSKFRINSKNST